MRMTVLASGSKGNSTVIASDRTRVLVDAGLSCRELLRRMEIAGEDASRLDAILITHEHVDHVAGLAVLARRLGIPVYFTEPTHRAWVRMLTPRTTLTYAKWLELRQAEKQAKAAAVPCYEPTAPAVEMEDVPAACGEPDASEGAGGEAQVPVGLDGELDGLPEAERWSTFAPGIGSPSVTWRSAHSRFLTMRPIRAALSSSRAASAWRSRPIWAIFRPM
jgi:hypothetical protein